MFQQKDTVSIEIEATAVRFQGDIHCVRQRFLVLDCHPADVAQCPVGTPIRLSHAADGTLYQFDTEVAGAQANNLIVPRWTPRIVQRRNAARIPCDLQGRYQRRKARNDSIKPVSDEEKPARIYDISMGGARGYVAEALFADTPLRLQICLTETDGPGEWITADVVVLRCALRTEEKAGSAEFPYEACFRITTLARMDRLALTRTVQRDSRGI